MLRSGSVAALVALAAVACVALSEHPYASAHWVGTFVLDTDETRSGTECTLHRIVHIDAALDCGPAYVVGDVARYVCGGAGSAHYSYTRTSDGGAQTQAGSGSYTGEISGLFEIYQGRYRFEAQPRVSGQYDAAKGAYTSSGPERFVLSGVIQMEAGDIPHGARTITFDQDQTARIEGLDCKGIDSGRRHMTFNLADRPDLRRVPLQTPTPTASARATGDGTPRPGTTDVPVGDRPVAIALNPKTARAYVANSGDGTVSVIDTVTARVVATIAVGPDPSAIAVSPPNDRVYVVHGNQRRLSVIDGQTDRVIGTIPVDGRPANIAVHPGTGRVYVTVGTGALRVVDVASTPDLGEVKIVEGAGAIALNSVSERIYVSTGSGHISVIDARTNRTLIGWRLGSEAGGVGQIAVNAATDLVYVADGTYDGAWTIDSRGTQHRVTALVPLPREPWDLLLREETNRVYATNLSFGEVYVIDGGSGQIIETIPSRGMAWGIWDIAVDPATGRIFAAVSDRDTVMVLR